MLTISSMVKKLCLLFLFVPFSCTILGPAVAQASGVTPINDVQPLALQAQVLKPQTHPAEELPLPTVAHPTKKIVVEVTAYTSSADQTDSTPFTTANGLRVQDGFIAANMLPFGTKVRIPALFGNKVFTVQDRMNARYQNNVDVWVDTMQKARNIGRRHLTIEVF